MSGSASERAIRDYAADRLRAMMPEARIIHELVVGTCRADLAAVEPERITLVEIKSEKDTLTRLERQVKHFDAAGHDVVVVAHQRWFDTTPYNDGRPRFVPSEALAAAVKHKATVWAYPELHDRPNYATWSLPHWRRNSFQPRASHLLQLLWKAELLEEAYRHRISATSRSTVYHLVGQMAWLMTGQEIARAVCRQLRGRVFPEADAPISAQAAA